MSSFKEQGTKAFAAKDFKSAVEHFTKAIEENPSDHTLFSNRSACYYNLNQSSEALEDADKCVELKPDWGKAY